MFKIPVPLPCRYLEVSNECKKFIVYPFQSMLFAKFNYKMPTVTQVTEEFAIIIKNMEEKQIEINGETFFQELKKYTDEENSDLVGNIVN